MKIHDSIFGLLFMALGATVLAVVSTYPKMPGQDVGPAIFPGIACFLLALFGLVMLVRSRIVAGPRRLLVLGDWVASPRHIGALVAVVAGVAAYAALSNRIGFLVLMPPLLFVWHRSFGVRWTSAALSAVVTTIAVWLLFYRLLGVPLPWGILKTYAF